MMPICLQCKRPFGRDELAVTASSGERLDFFCSERCRRNYVYPKLTNRICVREGCSNPVPEGHRMLCLECYYKGSNLGERTGSFNAADRGAWERRVEAIRKRIEAKVRVFSAQDMTQEELRALVPSLREGSE